MAHSIDAQRTVMIFGTFDGIHEGHRFVFQSAKDHGDRLIVVIARDETVRGVKGHKPLYSEFCRLEDVLKEPLVDYAILGNGEDKYLVLKKYRPKVICLGYDQTYFVDVLYSKLKEIGLPSTEIIRLKAFHPERYKSSILNKGVI